MLYINYEHQWSQEVGWDYSSNLVQVSESTRGRQAWRWAGDPGWSRERVWEGRKHTSLELLCLLKTVSPSYQGWEEEKERKLWTMAGRLLMTLHLWEWRWENEMKRSRELVFMGSSQGRRGRWAGSTRLLGRTDHYYRWMIRWWSLRTINWLKFKTWAKLSSIIEVSIEYISLLIKITRKITNKQPVGLGNAGIFIVHMPKIVLDTIAAN